MCRPPEIFSDDTGWTVLTQAGFGHDWSARLLLLASLAGAILWWSRLNSRLAKLICVPLAAALVDVGRGWRLLILAIVGILGILQPGVQQLAVR